MGYFATFELMTGRCISAGHCQDGLEARQSGNDCVAVATEHYLDVREWRMHEGELKRMPPRPSDHHRFDYRTGEWHFDAESAWSAVRLRRSEIFAAIAWRVEQAVEGGGVLSPEWLAYRQALRDITQQQDPSNIVWPEPPEEG